MAKQIGFNNAWLEDEKKKEEERGAGTGTQLTLGDCKRRLREQ